MDAYLNTADVGRPAPNTQALVCAFREQVVRKQRRSDGTISLGGKRFEIPNALRQFEKVTIRYTPWDMRFVSLVDARSGDDLCRLHPLDKQANADRRRRAIKTQTDVSNAPAADATPTGVAPLLKKLMREHAATGLPPAYLPRPEED